jgi:hypothetical protein
VGGGTFCIKLLFDGAVVGPGLFGVLAGAMFGALPVVPGLLIWFTGCGRLMSVGAFDASGAADATVAADAAGWSRTK